MASVNKVILLGNLGKDPDIRYLPDGSAITAITLATHEVWKDKQTGQSQERTEWHRVVCFGRLAEIAGEYLRKGRPVYVEGSLRTRKWQDKNGQDRYTTEIVASELKLLGSARDNGAEPPASVVQPSTSARASIGTPPADSAPAPASAGADDDEDTIPF